MKEVYQENYTGEVHNKYLTNVLEVTKNSQVYVRMGKSKTSLTKLELVKTAFNYLKFGFLSLFYNECNKLAARCKKELRTNSQTLVHYVLKTPQQHYNSMLNALESSLMSHKEWMDAETPQKIKFQIPFVVISKESKILPSLCAVTLNTETGRKNYLFHSSTQQSSEEFIADILNYFRTNFDSDTKYKNTFVYTVFIDIGDNKYQTISHRNDNRVIVGMCSAIKLRDKKYINDNGVFFYNKYSVPLTNLERQMHSLQRLSDHILETVKAPKLKSVKATECFIRLKFEKMAVVVQYTANDLNFRQFVARVYQDLADKLTGEEGDLCEYQYSFQLKLDESKFEQYSIGHSEKIETTEPMMTRPAIGGLVSVYDGNLQGFVKTEHYRELPQLNIPKRSF